MHIYFGSPHVSDLMWQLFRGLDITMSFLLRKTRVNVNKSVTTHIKTVMKEFLTKKLADCWKRRETRTQSVFTNNAINVRVDAISIMMSQNYCKIT